MVGRTFHQEAEAGKPEPLFEIVGVVRSTKYYELREDFLPMDSTPGTFPGNVIAGNNGSGVEVAGSDNTHIDDNLIGVASGGILPLPTTTTTA